MPRTHATYPCHSRAHMAAYPSPESRIRYLPAEQDHHAPRGRFYTMPQRLLAVLWLSGLPCHVACTLECPRIF